MAATTPDSAPQWEMSKLIFHDFGNPMGKTVGKEMAKNNGRVTVSKGKGRTCSNEKVEMTDVCQ